MSFLLVSGLSGSGKSIVLHALEDSGFYCIDNMPARLLPHLAEQIQQSSDKLSENVAVGIDARNKEFLKELPEALDKLSRLGINYQIVFLEADDAILIKRYKETRRKHPLTDGDVSLLEGIALEKTNSTRFHPTLHYVSIPRSLRRMISDNKYWISPVAVSRTI